VRGDVHRRRLDAVRLERDEDETYVALHDGARLCLDRSAGLGSNETSFPLYVVGELGAELTADEAHDLAYALLALLRERTRRAYRAAGLDETPAPFLDTEELP
jgi:hypothetical protein